MEIPFLTNWFHSASAYLENLPWLNQTFLNNSLADYLVAVAIVGVVFGIIHVCKTWLFNLVSKLDAQFQNKWLHFAYNLISVINFPFYLAISVYLALRYLDFGNEINSYLNIIIIVIITIYLGLGINKTLESVLEVLAVDEETENNNGFGKLDANTADFLKMLGSLIVWIILILVILNNLGFDLASVLGGLGIAGVIIAFAMQNILSDIFAYFTIHLDKPFKKGDFIVLEQDIGGKVKHIGIKNTRLKTLHGQDLIINNRELTNARINNYANMERRRVVIKFGVAYDTPKEKLAQIPEYIKEIIDVKDITTFDRAHLREFGESSLNFEVVYFVETPNYNSYMDVHQQILLEIIDKFNQEKIRFAFPARVVYLQH